MQRYYGTLTAALLLATPASAAIVYVDADATDPDADGMRD